MNNKDSLEYRIKKYEYITRSFLIPRMPIIIRLDGKSFHTFTKQCKKPFDLKFRESMLHAALTLSKEMQGFKLAYIQSDEVSFLLTDYDTLTTQGWFGYNISKITSISASLMSVYFNKIYNGDKLGVFDSRVFNVPIDDVSNSFLWRAKDWERNSLQMYARSFFSHKQLNNKNKEAIHEMLHRIGKNWTTDLCDSEKNGFYIIKNDTGVEIKSDIKPNYEQINNIINNLISK